MSCGSVSSSKFQLQGVNGKSKVSPYLVLANMVMAISTLIPGYHIRLSN